MRRSNRFGQLRFQHIVISNMSSKLPPGPRIQRTIGRRALKRNASRSNRAEDVRLFEDSQRVSLASFQKCESRTRGERAAKRWSMPLSPCCCCLRAARREEPRLAVCCLGKVVRGTAEGQWVTRLCVHVRQQNVGLSRQSTSFAAPFPNVAAGFPRTHSRRNWHALRPPTTTASRTQRTEPRTQLARGEAALLLKLVGMASR